MNLQIQYWFLMSTNILASISPQKCGKRDGRNALIIGTTPPSQKREMKRGRSIALSQEEPMMRQSFSSCHGYQEHGDHGGYFPQHPPQHVSGMYTNIQSNDHLNLNCCVAPHYFPLPHVPSVTPNGEYSSLHAQTNIFNSSSDSAAEQNSSLSGEIP